MKIKKWIQIIARIYQQFNTYKNIIKQKLKKNPESIFNNHEIITRLEAVKAELIQIKNQL
mgnify:CR=1 FL=1